MFLMQICIFCNNLDVLIGSISRSAGAHGSCCSRDLILGNSFLCLQRRGKTTVQSPFKLLFAMVRVFADAAISAEDPSLFFYNCMLSGICWENSQRKDVSGGGECNSTFLRKKKREMFLIQGEWKTLEISYDTRETLMIHKNFISSATIFGSGYVQVNLISLITWLN